jgi:hypothetical protein
LRHFGGLDHLAGPDGVAAALLAAGGGFGTADASRIFPRAPFAHIDPRLSRRARSAWYRGRCRRSKLAERLALLVALALFLGLAFEEIYDALAALNVLL